MFNARVWLGCLRSGIELVKAGRLDSAEPQLVKAFVAAKLKKDCKAAVAVSSSL